MRSASIGTCPSSSWQQSLCWGQDNGLGLGLGVGLGVGLGLGLGLGVISRLPAPSRCPPLGDGPSACWASSAASASVRRAGHAAHGGQHTHGSGECMGEEAWRMYWVHWNTRKARLARKSRADSRPATGRSWKPVRSARAMGGGQRARQVGGGHRAGHPGALPSGGAPFRKREMSSSWGMLSAR